MNLVGGKCDAGEIGIVGAVGEDEVDAAHAQEQGDQGDGGELVFGEELFGSDKSAGDAKQDHKGAEDCGPPADKQRGLVLRKRSQRRGI